MTVLWHHTAIPKAGLKLSFFFIPFLSFFFLNWCSSTVVFIFSPLTLHTLAIHTSHPPSYPPLALSVYPLYTFLDNPSTFSTIIPSHYTSVYCQFVFCFNVSGYNLLTYLFCCLGSTYSWDHMAFAFTTWFISLSIMLFRSIILSWRVGPTSFLLHSIPLSKCSTVFWSPHLLMGT